MNYVLVIALLVIFGTLAVAAFLYGIAKADEADMLREQLRDRDALITDLIMGDE